jgi:ABC-type nitrate/sulfonate/bicarbonate transport system substrate-binding protein
VFFDNAMRGDYDLSVAAPHFARVAQADRGMVPVVMYEPRVQALFIGLPDDGIHGPADVRGKTVAIANPTSLVALYGLQWFRQAGVEPGKDFGVRGVITAAEALQAVARLQAAVSAEGGAAPDEDAEPDAARAYVPLRTRVQPFVEMLEKANARGSDILWGV